MNAVLNSLPVSIRRTEAKFSQVRNMTEYYTRVLENLRPDEVIEMTFADEESRHRAHTSILGAAAKKWGKGRVKTGNTIANHTVRIWFNPVFPAPDLDPLETIQVPLEKLETLTVDQ